MARVFRYETLILTVPEITGEESSKFEAQFSKLIKEAKGNLISFDKWGKYKLAYPVRKNEYGVYYLTRFEIPIEEKEALFSDFKNLFKIKFNDIIMRYLISVLPSNASLDYTKPKSLEETPQEIDTLLQKNKVKNSNYEEKDLKLGVIEEEYDEE